MSSNTFVTPRSVSTLSQARIDFNNSLTALLQNFASPAAPVAGSVNIEGVTGLKEGMLWYKSGSNTTIGQGRLLIYKDGGFTRNGISVISVGGAVSANVAASNGNLVVGDLVDIGDERLYRVHSSGQYIVDVGIPPVGYTVGNADLLDNLDSSQFLRSDAADSFSQPISGTHMLTLSNTTATSKTAAALWLSGATGALMMDSAGQRRIAWDDGGSDFGIYSGVYYNAGYKYTVTGDGATQILSDSDSAHGVVTIRVADLGTAEATPVWKQTLILNNSTFTINSNTIWHAGNDGSGSGLDADTLDGTQLATIQNAYAANDWNTLLTARANDWATWVSAQGNDHATLLTARSNDFATFTTLTANDWNTYNTLTINTGATLNTARGNDHATLLIAQANDFTTYSILAANDFNSYNTIVSNYNANDFATFNAARSNDWATWVSAQGNDHATLLTARSNDWATWVSAQGNDHATLLTARSNDFATYSVLAANDFNSYNTVVAGYSANDFNTLTTTRSNDFNTWASAQGNDHATLLTARANDWATWVSAQGNDHATLLSARANDFATFTTLTANDFNTYNTLTINTGTTLNTARANDWATWGAAQGNDHVTFTSLSANDFNTYNTLTINTGTTLNTARANDYATFLAASANDYNTLLTSRSNEWATWASAQGNDHNTLLTARSNDFATWASAQGNDHTTLLTARSNDWATWASAQGNDHSTLLSARSNDFATFTTLTANDWATFNTLDIRKMNLNATALTNAVDLNSVVNGLYVWTSGVSAPTNIPFTNGMVLQSNSGAEDPIQIAFTDTSIATRRKTGGTWTSWQAYWNSTNDGSGSGLDADLLDGVNLATIQAAYAANDFATWASAQGNDHATLLTARSNDFATWNAAQGNDHATLLTARSNDFATWNAAQGNDHSTLLSARANDFATYNALIGLYAANDFNTYNTLTINTGSTLNTARANDWATWGAAQGNDHSTLLTARSNDFATWNSAQGNDHNTLLTARSNDWATWASAQGNDHATLLSARANDVSTWQTAIANDWATYNTLNTNKANLNTTFLTNATNLDTLPNGWYSWTSGIDSPTGATLTDALMLQSNNASNSQEHQIVFGESGLAIRTAAAGVWGSWVNYWNNGNDGASSGLDADLLDGLQGSSYVQTSGNQTIDNEKTFTSSVILSNADPLVRFIETDTTTAARILLTGSTLYLQSGAAGVGETASQGDIYVSGFNGNDVNSFKVRLNGVYNTIWHEGKAEYFDDVVNPTSLIKFGRNSGQYVTFHGNAAATYMDVISTSVNPKDLRIQVSNSTIKRDFVFNLSEGEFSARQFSNENDTFVVGNLGAVTALSVSAATITSTGRVWADDGTEASPGFRFNGAATGMYREPSGRIAFAVGGAKVANSSGTLFTLDAATSLRSLGTYNQTNVNGANMYISASGDFFRSTSSAKYKTNIETMIDDYADAIVYGLRPVYYKSTCPSNNPDWGHWGFIAEEVAEVDPRLVFFKEHDNGYLEAEGVQYDRSIPAIINVLQRQKDTIEALQQELLEIKQHLGLI